MSKFSFPENVLFRHIRLYDKWGELSAKGGYTIAYYIDHQEQVVDFAVAKCRIEELFRRDKGRQESLERLTKYRAGEEIITKDGRPMAFTFTADDLSQVISKNFSDGLNAYIEQFFYNSLREEVADREFAANPTPPGFSMTLKIEEINVHVVIQQMEAFINDTSL